MGGRKREREGRGKEGDRIEDNYGVGRGGGNCLS